MLTSNKLKKDEEEFLFFTINGWQNTTKASAKKGNIF